ncbi:MAG: exo-alpha-sialidase [Armatimonadetes bacterium]|nr:exo-alpha-sialidase [Armatimonadota bacterium]
MLFLASLCLTMIDGPFVFPPEKKHNHGSCIVELKSGDLFACWYSGSGERKADDVRIEGAVLRKGSDDWSERFVLVDTPGMPDCNPCMMVAPDGRLWLWWITVQDNEWESSLLKYRTASKFDESGRPVWDGGDVLHAIPKSDFQSRVDADCDIEEKKAQTELDYYKERRRKASIKLNQRLGWMTRARPTVASKGRWILPLYSDGFDFSIMLLSDDEGKSWSPSDPLISRGGVQPSVIERKDGTLVAIMRDNGPPPQRAMISESSDGGETWSPVRDSEIPNPGSGLEWIRLHSGRWALVHNDTEEGRQRLSLWLSDDEGKTWRWKTAIEQDESGSFSYPSIIETSGGELIVSYSWSKGGLESIKVARLSENEIVKENRR